MLNLIIALLSDTFDQVNLTSHKREIKEKALLMVENEFIFFRSIVFKKAKYVIMISNQG